MRQLLVALFISITPACVLVPCSPRILSFAAGFWFRSHSTLFALFSLFCLALYLYPLVSLFLVRMALLPRIDPPPSP